MKRLLVVVVVAAVALLSGCTKIAGIPIVGTTSPAPTVVVQSAPAEPPIGPVGECEPPSDVVETWLDQKTLYYDHSVMVSTGQGKNWGEYWWVVAEERVGVAGQYDPSLRDSRDWVTYLTNQTTTLIPLNDGPMPFDPDSIRPWSFVWWSAARLEVGYAAELKAISCL